MPEKYHLYIHIRQPLSTLSREVRTWSSRRALHLARVLSTRCIYSPTFFDFLFIWNGRFLGAGVAVPWGRSWRHCYICVSDQGCPMHRLTFGEYWSPFLLLSRLWLKTRELHSNSCSGRVRDLNTSKLLRTMATRHKKKDWVNSDRSVQQPMTEYLYRHPRNCLHYIHQLRHDTCFDLTSWGPVAEVSYSSHYISRKYLNLFDRFLRHLKIMAVDELHYYSNLFGRWLRSTCIASWWLRCVQSSHVAQIMRRFRRVCAAVGSAFDSR